MSPERKDDDLGLRPLTARSVLLSTLLGVDPPVLPVRRLVATAGLFGISEGSARTALSRMVTTGEVVADDGRYRLTGRLLERQRRQATGRRPEPRSWTGDWLLAVVVADRRSAADRAELRSALSGARLAEWREGVWVRPDNLDRPDLPAAVAAHVTWVTGRIDDPPVSLWDVDAWADRASRLLDRLAATPLDDPSQLAPGFVVSAAVLRHLAADPLLPPELLPAGWPGEELRRAYDAWDRDWRALLAAWHRATTPAAPDGPGRPRRPTPRR